MNVKIFTIHDNLDSTYSRHDTRRKATKNEPKGFKIKREKVKQQEKRKGKEKNYKNIEIKQKSFCSGKDAYK